MASVLNDGREVIGREAKGRFIPLYMTIGKLPSDGGFCAVMRDITNWKRAEEELTEARRQAEDASSQKTQFLARVSHEIRTPLNAIIGFSELMLGERFGPIGNQRYKDYLRDINRSGNHVLDLVNDLLDISKIEAGHQELSHEAVPLNDILSEAVAIMQPQANRERVIIRSSLVSGLPDVVRDVTPQIVPASIPLAFGISVADQVQSAPTLSHSITQMAVSPTVQYSNLPV